MKNSQNLKKKIKILFYCNELNWIFLALVWNFFLTVPSLEYIAK